MYTGSTSLQSSQWQHSAFRPATPFRQPSQNRRTPPSRRPRLTVSTIKRRLSADRRLTRRHAVREPPGRSRAEATKHRHWPAATSSIGGMVKAVASLVNRIRTSMPADNVGSLNTQTSTDIVAYIMQANKFPTGQDELKTARSNVPEDDYLQEIARGEMHNAECIMETGDSRDCGASRIK